MDGIYTFEDKAETYQTLREEADTVEESPAVENISDYDAVIEIDGEMYGAKFEKGQAASEQKLRDSGAEVYGARQFRGSESAGILAETMSDMTVEEAVNAGLEPEEKRAPGEEPESAGSSQNLRYGLGKVMAE